MSDLIKEGVNKRTKERKLLESLFVWSLDGEKDKVPGISEFALGEVVNSVVEYIGGEGEGVLYRRNISEQDFRDKLFKYLVSELENHKDILVPEIEERLVLMTKPFSDSCPPDRPVRMTSLEEYYIEESFCNWFATSRGPLPEGMIERVKSRDYSPQYLNDVKGIGKAMRSFIEDDLEFISETYSW
jgi:hypothetical protein